MSASDYLEDALLSLVLNGVPFAAPEDLYVSLHLAASGDGLGEEVSGGGYARVLGQFSNVDAGSSQNENEMFFGPMPDAVITHWGIFDAASNGNLLIHSELDAPITTQVGDSFRFGPGTLTVGID